jgi:hypothetical protein
MTVDQAIAGKKSEANRCISIAARAIQSDDLSGAIEALKVAIENMKQLEVMGWPDKNQERRTDNQNITGSPIISLERL